MPVIVPANQLNVAALTADDLYIAILNPPGYISGVPTDVIGLVGTAAWGPVNKAVHLGSAQDALQNFGPISVASLTDPYDLATDLALAFGQASSQASLEGWAVRVTDGTDAAAHGTLSGAASHAAETATIGGTATAADVLTISASGGIVGSASYTVPGSGGPTTTTIAAGLAAAINATPAFAAANVFATNTGPEILIYIPSASSATWAESVTGAVPNATVTIGGTITDADTITLTFTNSHYGAWPTSVVYTVHTGDTLGSIAASLAALINADTLLTAVGVSAAVNGDVITVSQNDPNGSSTVLTDTVGGSATETVTLSNGGDLTAGPTETITLSTGTAATVGMTLTGIFTGSLGNSIQANIALGSATGTFTTIINGPGNLAEYYPNLPGAGFFKALGQAINFGLSGVRGPSQIVRASLVNAAVGPPTPGLYTLSSGTDGRAVSPANLLGTDSLPGTGIYALRQLKPNVGIAWIVGLTDSSVWAACLAFAQSEGTAFLATMPVGSSTSAALTEVSNNGIHDPSFTYVKDWIYFFDPINGNARLVPPTAVIGGTCATLAPQISPSNKPVSLVIGTERFNQWTGQQPYTVSEVGQLESAGIMFVTQPVPGGAYWGIRHGQTTSLLPVTQPFEWWRMTSYLARSFASVMGIFVGQNQSQQPNDPTRAAVRNQLNQFLQFLKSPSVGAGDGLGQIDDFSVVCTFAQNGNAGLGVNTPTSISQHYLFALVRVRYLSSIRFFVLSLQGGTTVVTAGATPGQQLIQQAA